MSDDETATDQRRTGDENRRSFLKKGALASGAMALGGSAIGSAAGQEDTPTETPTGGGMQGVIFSYDYYPGTTFVVEGPLNSQTARDMLDGVQDQGIDEIPNPSSWDGYVIRYRFASQGGVGGGRGQGGIFAFLFSQQSLQKDQAYRFGQQTSVLSPELNLLQVQLQQAPSGQTGGNQTGGNQTGGNQTT